MVDHFSKLPNSIPATCITIQLKRAWTVTFFIEERDNSAVMVISLSKAGCRKLQQYDGIIAYACTEVSEGKN